MLLDAIVKLHDKIQNMKLGVNREREVTELEEARLRRLPLATDLTSSQSRTAAASGPTLLDTPALPSPAVRSRNLGMTSVAEPEPAVPRGAPPAETRAAETEAAEARASEAGAAGE
jgi:hypothetical protein